MADEHRGRGAGNADHVVVLGHPEAMKTKSLDVSREVNAVPQSRG
jgi:hypothetical protein